MLNAAREPATGNQIIYRSFTSFRQVQEHVQLLIANDLLQSTGEKQFVTTKKGLRFCDLFEVMRLPISGKLFEPSFI
jgi:predicted transcriptional regulator